MRGRCAWTNRESDQLKEVILVAPNRLGLEPKPRAFYVLPEFEPSLRSFVERFRRFGLVFLSSILLLTIGMVVAAGLQQLSVIAAMVALMGVLIIVLPFATPETVKRFGFRTSIIIVRIIGVALLLIAAWLMTLKRG